MHWFWKYDFWKNSLGLFRGRWGQEVIFEVTEAKFWISSSFCKFSFRIFVVLDFEVVWPRRPQRPRRSELVGFQTMLILDPFDMTFDAVGVFGLAFWLLFKSTSSYCVIGQSPIKTGFFFGPKNRLVRGTPVLMFLQNIISPHCSYSVL